ncbi:MAG: transglycosylase SLT domain-containing protein [Deltaproteobacteria bacterium]|nr:transglycosylase SLT domain-containing protein [Deltaproteobacteria bacterium]
MNRIRISFALISVALWVHPAQARHRRARRPASPHYILTAPLSIHNSGRRHIRGDVPNSSFRPESIQAMDQAEAKHDAEVAVANARQPNPRGTGPSTSRSPIRLPARSRSANTGAPQQFVPVPPPGSPAWMHTLKMPDISFRWNKHLIHYLMFYHDTKHGHDILASWFRDMGRYEHLIRSFLRQSNLPQDLIYISMIESGFNARTLSYAGASGLWQFMPAGGRIYGLRYDYWFDERKDPLRSTMAGMKYLADLHHRFGNWPIALAAFNAGYGAVTQAMRRFNTNDYWTLCEFEAGLPYSTTKYVPKFLAVAIAGHNRAEFNLTKVQPRPEWDYDVITVRGPVSLRRIARLAGASLKQMRYLNPALRRSRVPPYYKSFQVRIPRGAKRRFLSRAGATKLLAGRHALHRLRWGETLDDVARLYGTRTSVLRKLNGIRSSRELRPGVPLLVPLQRHAARRTESAQDRPLVVLATTTPVPPKGQRMVLYRACPGDTIASLARLFHCKRQQLLEWNQVADDSNLVPGLFLTVFLPRHQRFPLVRFYRPKDVDLVVVDSPEFFDKMLARRGLVRITYRARRNDTMKRLSRRFHLSAGSIARINHISRFSHLKAGQLLVLYVDAKRMRSRRMKRHLRHRRPNAHRAVHHPSRPRSRPRPVTSPTSSATTKARPAPKRTGMSARPAPPTTHPARTPKTTNRRRGTKQRKARRVRPSRKAPARQHPSPRSAPHADAAPRPYSNPVLRPCAVVDRPSSRS